MQRDVVLITNFWHFQCEKSSSRYLSLAELLVKQGYKLEVITSNFYHRTKCMRNYPEEYLKSFPYKITLLDEPIYKKNISIKRLYAHYMFANQVMKYLKERKKPDVIITVIPTHNLAKKVVRFCKQKKIPVILDVQDLWPEAFQMAMDIPIVSNIVFFPIKRQADYAYKNADYIIGVSETYVERALKAGNIKKKNRAIYLGADLNGTKSAASKIPIEKPRNEFWITYIGALGHSYDIKLVIDAIYLLKQKGINNIRFHVFGNGVLEEEFKKYANSKNVDVKFWGHTEYRVMMAWLSNSDVAVNPIIGKSVASIINKVCDYAAAGIPVVNEQDSDEYRNMLERYKCGINCENGNVKEFSEAILYLYDNPEIRERMKENSLKMAEENFNRDKTYMGFVDAVESFWEGK